jgi:hypothetical protein
VITCYSIEDHLAVVNLLMERCGAGKDVVHAWDSMGMVGGGESSIGSVFVVPMMEKSVPDTQGVGSENLEKIFSTSIGPRNTIWSKDLLLFVAGCTPILALMSPPIMICLFGLMVLRMESSNAQNCLWR